MMTQFTERTRHQVYHVLVVCTLVVSVFLGAESNASTGAPTPAEFQELLKLDYHSFDQSLADGGWRGIGDLLEQAKVLDAYAVHNRSTLLDWQLRTITWHAGQTYAIGSLTDITLNRFQNSFNPSEPLDSNFKWNAYVRGSIAFLKKDRATLVAAREEVSKSTEGLINLKVLDGFLACFDKSYSEAYNTPCRKP